MIAPIRAGEADIVSAARRLDEGIDAAALGPFRLGLSKIGNRLSRFVLGRDIADPLTGFFVIRRDAFLRAAPRAARSRLQAAARHPVVGPRRSGTARCRSISAQRLHGESKLNSFVAWQFATYLMSKLTRGIVPASLISFLIVGGSGVFVHLAVLYAALSATGQFALSQTAAALAAVTSNFLLNNRLTFRDKRLRGTQAGLRLPQIPGHLVDRHRRQRLDRHLTYEEVGQIALLAAFAGIALDTLWKFVVSSRFVWN